ncbi:MAG: zinc ribbon domain-containing protein [Acholeplasmatales bacterium]|jgi:hypothetical protein|nr:zinc ribbon domain-containing protein [Acholeplasmatales bacterium]
MKVCGNCGVGNVEDSIFCVKCGFKFEELKCESCGGTLAFSDKFCPHCGKNISIIKKEKEETVLQEEKHVEVKTTVFSKKDETTKKIVWVVSICASFIALAFIVISFFSNWLEVSGLLKNNVFINAYDVFFDSLNKFNYYEVEIFQTIRALGIVFTKMSDNISLSTDILTLLFPLLIIFVVKTVLFLLGTSLIIITITTAAKKNTIPPLVAKFFTGIACLYVIVIVFVGNVTTGVYITLVVTVLCVALLKVGNYLLQEKRKSVISFIPNIIGSFFLIISFILLSGYSSYVINIDGLVVSLKSFIKYPLISSYLLTEHSTVLDINMVLFFVTTILLVVYMVIRLFSTLTKVKPSIKKLGWTLQAFMTLFCITNLLVMNLLTRNGFTYMHYGTTVVILVFLLITGISDAISIKPKTISAVNIKKDSNE